MGEHAPTMTSMRSSRPVRTVALRTVALRSVGALTAAASVAFVGVAALPPALARAAGVVDDHPKPVHHPRHPSALPSTDTKVVASSRWADGRWVPA